MFNLPLQEFLLATWQTIYMVFFSSLLSVCFGLLMGVVLFITAKKQTALDRFFYQCLSFIVNVTRSIPFIILMIAVIPFTRWVVGSSIGTNAAIVPLTLAAMPFFARIAETAILEVPVGLVEAGRAMGASTWQIIYKILLPEATASLTRGATLTIIGLVGYSAMAGAVGGGGLGQLAIDYGYQRFDPGVMLLTVILLVVMVQIIQCSGDFLAKKPHVKFTVLAFIVLIIASAFGGQAWSIGSNGSTQSTLRVGIMSGVSEKVMKTAQQVAQKQYHLTLKIIPFSDYVLPNTALNNGDIDANIFQHLPYLEAQAKARGYHLVPLAKTFVYPMGFFSKKITALNQLPNDAIIAIPNDPSNEGRALLLLEKANLIKLNPKAGLFATTQDITANPKHLRFKVLNAAQLPRVFQDADLVALTNDYIKPAGFSIKQALIKEDANSPYANIIAVRVGNQNNPALQDLAKVMHSKPVLEETQKIYPDGAAIPAY